VYWLEIVKNNAVLAIADRDDLTSTLLVMNLIVGLQTGDTVYIRQHSDHGSVDTGNDNVFTGFLVR
jgi:hypothetical protein